MHRNVDADLALTGCPCRLGLHGCAVWLHRFSDGACVQRGAACRQHCCRLRHGLIGDMATCSRDVTWFFTWQVMPRPRGLQWGSALDLPQGGPWARPVG